MARTYFTYTGDGVRTVYPVVFALGYLQRSDVHVYTGDDPNTQLEYTWQDSATIELNTPVPTGTPLTIRRIAQRTSAINDYQDGAVLNEHNLDNSFAQGLMLDEELSDGFFVGHDEELLVQHDLNLAGNNLKGVGYATLPDEAVPLAQSDERLAAGLATKLPLVGGTMTGPLGVVNSARANAALPRSAIEGEIDARLSANYMSRTQVVSAIDNMQRQLLDLINVTANIEDFGFITVDEDITEDYGLVSAMYATQDDYGKLIITQTH